jgi:hypothetical protein
MLETYIGGGLIDWIDNGSEYDDYRSVFECTVMQSAEIDELIQGVYYAEVNTLKTDEDSVYPMSPLFDYSGGVDVVLEQIAYKSRVNIFGEYAKYSFKISNKATPPPATEEHGCDFIGGWSFDGLLLPYPQSSYQHKNNNTLLGFGHNGNYTDTTTAKRQFGNVTDFKLLCGMVQARALLDKLRSVRGTAVTVQNPAPYYYFGYQYPEFVSVKIASSRITCSQKTADRCEIGFSLMIMGIPD